MPQHGHPCKSDHWDFRNAEQPTCIKQASEIGTHPKIQKSNNIPKDEEVHLYLGDFLESMRWWLMSWYSFYCNPSSLASTVQSQHSVLVQGLKSSSQLYGLVSSHILWQWCTWHWASCSTAGVAKYEGGFLKVQWKQQICLCCPNSCDQ